MPSRSARRAHQRQNLVEVRLHLKRSGAVFERLRQFAVGDIAVRDEDDGLQSGGAGVGGHGGRRVAGGDAGHALHPQAHGLRSAAGHAVVLERAGGIEALVLENQPVKPGVGCGARGGEQRRVAFAQGDHGAVVVQERE